MQKGKFKIQVDEEEDEEDEEEEDDAATGEWPNPPNKA